MLNIVLKRFLKGFVASGVSSLTAQLAQGIYIHNSADLKNAAITLGIAFFAGAILGTEKYINLSNASLRNSSLPKDSPPQQ